MNNEKYYGYLYETIIPMSDGEKHYYGKKEYDRKLYKGNKVIYSWYWGSGVIIKAWFKKHTFNKYNSRCCPEEIAKQLGVKRIIHGFYKTKNELNIAEKELVKLHLGKSYCINIAEGGIGGNTYQKYKCIYLSKIDFENQKPINLNHKRGHPAWNKGIKYTKEQCDHIKELRKNIDMKGINNPAYGKYHWNNGIEHKFQKECPGEGWVRGMLPTKPDDKRHITAKISALKNLQKCQEARKKKVRCIELNITFSSIKEACKFFNKKCYKQLVLSCKNSTETWNNYHWEFID